MTTELSIICRNCGRSTDVTYNTARTVRCENCDARMQNILRTVAIRNSKEDDLDIRVVLTNSDGSGEPTFTRMSRVKCLADTDYSVVRARVHALVDGMLDALLDTKK